MTQAKARAVGVQLAGSAAARLLPPGPDLRAVDDEEASAGQRGGGAGQHRLAGACGGESRGLEVKVNTQQQGPWRSAQLGELKGAAQ